MKTKAEQITPCNSHRDTKHSIQASVILYLYCFQLFLAPWFPSVTPQPNSPKASQPFPLTVSQPSALIARTDPSIQAATKGTAAATDMVWNFAGPDLVGGLVHVTDLGGSYFYKDEWNSDSLLEMKQSIENLKNPIYQVIPYDENTGVIRDGMGTIVGVVAIVEGGVTLLKNALKIVEKTGNLFKSLEEFYKGSSLSSTRGGDLLATGSKSIKSVDELFPGVGGEQAKNKGLFEQYKDQLRQQMSKPIAINKELSNLIDDLYRPDAKVGSGSTADAVRHELITGEKVGGRRHITKAKEYSEALHDWIKMNPNASSSDRAVAENVLRDLQNSLQGK